MTAIDTLPAAPTRRAQSRQDFVTSIDAWMAGFGPWTQQANALGVEINTAASAVSLLVQDATAAVDRAENAASFKVSFAAESWAVLSAIAGSYPGQSAAVFDEAGNHTDPVVGGSVDNKGIYRWSASPAGWKWVSTGVGATVAWADITGKPSVFTPDAHTHAMSDITGLSSALGLLAPLADPTFTGTPDAPTAVPGTNTTQIATTAFVTAAIAGIGEAEMVYPASGIAVSSGSAWGASLAIPSGNLVGTTATQTMTNKTLGSGTVISAGTISGVTMTGGELRPGVVVSDTGTIAANSPGFRGMPGVNVTNRTIVAADMGKRVEFSGTVTFPAGLPADFACQLDNKSNSASSIATSGGQLLRKNKSTSTSTSASLAARGTAGAWMNAAGEIKLAGDIT